VLNSSQLNQPVGGAGSITIYSVIKHKPADLMKQWAYFFTNESCGQCTPCREGTFRLKEALKMKKVDWQLINDLLNNLEETSFCGLGLVVSTPFKSYFNNVLKR
jgi:formate dehydrogenase beta subunit